MTKKEFIDRMGQIDPEDSDALDRMAELFEEDYMTAGENLNDPEVIEDLLARAREDLEHNKACYDVRKDRIDAELRKAGATEAQINWGLFENIELPTISYIRCNRWARQLIRYCYQIQYCLAELKMLGKYTEIDEEELKAVQRDYGRRYG